MRKNMICVSIFIISLTGIVFFPTYVSLAQAQYPEIGQPSPEFTLKNIKYYIAKETSLKDFRGKWLLLDFWSANCGACIIGFPRMNDIQTQLNDKVQVIMVGIEDPKKQVELVYSKFRQKENLIVPCSFDSVLPKRFDISAVPRCVLIDDRGIIRAITSTINIEEMRGFLDGNPPKMERAYGKHDSIHEQENHEIPYDYEKPFAVNGNGANDTDFLFRSLLSAWRPGIHHPACFVSIDAALTNLKSGSFQPTGVTLNDLYFYAFLGTNEIPDSLYGKFYNKLALEVRDSSGFRYSIRTGENLYCYTVNMPTSLATVERIKGTMQRDLQNYFGFTACVEVRKCPCWKLVATKSALEKLKTKGGKEIFEGSIKFGYVAKNIPFTTVLNGIRAFNMDQIILDESCITGSVDITMDCAGCVLTDIYDVKRALRENGLDLVATVKEMRVLIIRDK